MDVLFDLVGAWELVGHMWALNGGHWDLYLAPAPLLVQLRIPAGVQTARLQGQVRDVAIDSLETGDAAHLRIPGRRHMRLTVGERRATVYDVKLSSLLRTAPRGEM